MRSKVEEGRKKVTGKNIVTINGRQYDALTGMPLAKSHQDSHTARPASRPKSSGKAHGSPPHRAFSDIVAPQTAINVPATKQSKQPVATAVHRKPQRARTLRRAGLKQPAAPAKTSGRSPFISRFGLPATQTLSAGLQLQPVPVTEDPQPMPPPAIIPPREHPMVAKALAAVQARTKPLVNPTQSSKELKEQLIKERLAEVEARPEPAGSHSRHFALRPRIATIMTSALAILLLGGYLTYLNLPSLSMRVAATRAGIAATLPNYQPDGYRIDGPITYQPGIVTINYRSTTNGENFHISQKTSTWDSQSLLDNYVSKQTGNYLTYQERGLTIYSFDHQAAWVNGGLFYSIDGSAQLSNEQVLRLATSM